MNFRISAWTPPLAAWMIVCVGCSDQEAHRDAAKIANDIAAQVKPVETERFEVVAQKPIFSALLGSEDGSQHVATLQETAADALARIGNDAVPALIAALEDKDPEVRSFACRSLSVMGDRAAPAVGALTARLSDPDENVRRAAARALGQIGPAAKSAIPALIELLRNKHAPAHTPHHAAPTTRP
ncbi:MAG: HEAT repeat domain-containing protein [Planctomycetes bacterium]|nr:HEAT repeat domain-containing protein [Planctomycetota bacterium]